MRQRDRLKLHSIFGQQHTNVTKQISDTSCCNGLRNNAQECGPGVACDASGCVWGSRSYSATVVLATHFMSTDIQYRQGRQSKAKTHNTRRKQYVDVSLSPQSNLVQSRYEQ